MDSSSKIMSRDEVLKAISALRKSGKRIGYTSGHFDLLHAGHISYLEEARTQCDCLVVGLNSDSSVRARKGELRPIIHQEDRARILSGLACVDFIFIFDELNNNISIELLKPDLYMKAGDYNAGTLSSAPIVESYGGKVLFIPLKPGRSSSGIVGSILERHAVLGIEATKIEKPERRPAVFIDRDGTLIEHVDYLSDPEKVVVFPGALEAVNKLRDSGFRIVMVTNQPGIAMGYFSKEDFFQVQRRFFREAKKTGTIFDRVYFCPHGHHDGCRCRKPEIGMIERAVRDLNIELEGSYVIGDMTLDIEMGKRAGVKSVLLQSGWKGEDGAFSIKPDITAKSFAEAATVILKEAAAKPPKAKSKGENALTDLQPLEAVGELAAKVGHDFNNLLGSIRCAVDLIHSKLTKSLPDVSSFDRQFGVINSSILRAVELTTKLRGYVRREEGERSVVPLSECAKSVLDLLRQSGPLPCEIDLNVRADPKVSVSEFQIVQMIMSLCMNSLEAMKGLQDRCLVVCVDETQVRANESDKLSPGLYAHLTVMDHGVGMSSDLKSKAFEPFFSSNKGGIGKGFGLSLAMAEEIMRRHNGQFVLTSAAGCGTVAQLYFPVVS